MTWDGAVIQYGEIALKGNNRERFENLLFLNLKNTLPQEYGKNLKKRYGRFVLEAEIKKEDEAALRGIFSKTFGVARFSFVKRAPLEAEAIKSAAATLIAEAKGDSFKISARRANKQFAKTSVELNAEIGAFAAQRTGKKVDVRSPDIVCSVLITEKESCISLGSFSGPAGLPAGISGKMLVLLSGGIDSPVAAWKMMRRGARVDFVHFHSYPYTDKASMEKVTRLAKNLADGEAGGTLYFVPFIDIQKAVMTSASSRYRVLLYRRLMLRIAELVAGKTGAEALVTGDSLGQVASQTLSNMLSVEAAVKIPVLRPLIGENKDDIIETAKKINTYEISIEPHEDCCSLFLPKNPATKSRIEDLEREEAKLPINELVKNAIKKVEKFNC